MRQKNIFALTILIVSAFSSTQSQGLVGLLPQISSLARSISISGSIRSGASAFAQSPSTRGGGSTSSQSATVNNGISTSSQSSTVNGGGSTSWQSSTLNGGGPTSSQSATVNKGGSTSSQSSTVNGGGLASSLSSTVSGGGSTSSQSSTVNGGGSTSSQSPSVNGVGFVSFQSSTVNGGTSAVSQPPTPTANFVLLQSPAANVAASPALQSSVAKDDLITSSLYNTDPLNEAKVEQFAHSLIQLLKTSDAIPVPGNSLVYPIYETTLAAANAVFNKLGVDNPTLAHHTAQVSESVNVLTLNLYYSVISHMIAKILGLVGLLTEDFLLYGPREVASFIESSAKTNGAEDSTAVVAAVYNGIFDFTNSLGLVSLENINLSHRIYEYYVTRLASGELA